MATQPEIPGDILIITGTAQIDDSDLEYRGLGSWLTKHSQPISIEHLHGQVNIFLQQLNTVLSNTPDKVGDFKLSEVEVSAGLVLQGETQVTLALVANAQIGAEFNAGLKFVFKRN